MMTDRRMRRSGASLRYRAGRLLVFAGAAAAAWAAVTLLSGGFVLRAGTFVLSSKDPIRPLVIAIALFAVARMMLAREAFTTAVGALIGSPDRWAARVALCAVAAVAIVAVAWN